MSRPRVYKTEAIVLRHQNLGDADKIVTVYSPYLGKLRLVGKGVLKPRSRVGGHVEPLSRVSLLIARGTEPGHHQPGQPHRKLYRAPG